MQVSVQRFLRAVSFPCQKNRIICLRGQAGGGLSLGLCGLGRRSIRMEADRDRSIAFHGILVFAMLAVVVAGFPPLPWPLHLLLPLLAYGAIVAAVPLLRRTAPSLAVGRMSCGPLACAVVLSIATAAVLIGFQAWAQPDVSLLAARLPETALRYPVAAGICFCLVNAALEEIVFRGVVWHIAETAQSSLVSLVVTAVLFGLGHLHGYPPGPIGAVLAGLYGLGLGLLRWWSGGLGLVIACHVCADAT